MEVEVEVSEEEVRWIKIVDPGMDGGGLMAGQITIEECGDGCGR